MNVCPRDAIYLDENKHCHIDQSKCIKCKLCIKTCPVQAISDDFVVDNSKCTRCNTCMEVCPKKTIHRVKKGDGFYSNLSK